MTRKRPSSLRCELRALRAEVALLRAELATLRAPVLPPPTVPAPQPWGTVPPVPFGGCDACRWSGSCNCVRYDQVRFTTGSAYGPALSACSPLDTTLRIAPGTSRMVSVPNAGAGAGWPSVTIYSTTSNATP